MIRLEDLLWGTDSEKKLEENGEDIEMDSERMIHVVCLAICCQAVSKVDTPRSTFGCK